MTTGTTTIWVNEATASIWVLTLTEQLTAMVRTILLLTATSLVIPAITVLKFAQNIIRGPCLENLYRMATSSISTLTLLDYRTEAWYAAGEERTAVLGCVARCLM